MRRQTRHVLLRPWLPLFEPVERRVSTTRLTKEHVRHSTPWFLSNSSATPKDVTVGKLSHRTKHANRAIRTGCDHEPFHIDHITPSTLPRAVRRVYFARPNTHHLHLELRRSSTWRDGPRSDPIRRFAALRTQQAHTSNHRESLLTRVGTVRVETMPSARANTHRDSRLRDSSMRREGDMNLFQICCL